MGQIAGGVWIALGVLIGAVIGIMVKQPTIGVLVGTGAGVLLAVVTALVDRRRAGRDG